MSQPSEPTNPASAPRRWLVAAWPGMGNVAILAAGYLIQKLSLRPVAELGTPGLFDVKDVEVVEGVITPPRSPRSLVFRPSTPIPGLELTVFLGEAQPDHGTMALAQGLLEHTLEYNIERVVTFASMSTQMHPKDQPRVFGAATSKELLEELRRAEVQVMQDGQIGGLNGVLLGAASQRELDGMCLLGEIPYFAAGVGNPKAARAVLDAFAVLARIELDLEEMAKHAESVEETLLKMHAELEDEGPDADEPGGEAGAAGERQGQRGDGGLLPADRARIEQMFTDAKKDQARVIVLKQELDRLGVFTQYEDRFLDLFRRAE